jgi:hypothetical protein
LSLTLRTAGSKRYTITIEKPQLLIDWYGGDNPDKPGIPNVKHGPDYYASKRVTGDPDELGFADLPWAVLLDGQPRGDGALHLLKLNPFDISHLPNVPLHRTTPAEREAIALAIEAICGSGIGCPIASKMLHPKRRESVPVLDNMAIFGSFDHENWQPWNPSISGGTIKRHPRILKALNHIYEVVSDTVNDSVWMGLEKANPPCTRVQLFDQVWWACRFAPALRVPAGVVVS